MLKAQITIWVILKTGQNGDILQCKNSECGLLFGNESYTSLMYLNIKQIDRVTETWLFVLCITSSVSVSHVTEDTRNALLQCHF